MNKQIGQILDERLKGINAKLRRFGVPFDLPKLGNFKEGEWEISDILSVSWFRNYILQIVFLMREPGTGREVEYQGIFNHTYSAEAKSGHSVIPIFRFGERSYFAMIYVYGPFVGRWSLLFPRGFIPAELTNASTTAIAKALYDRKVGRFLREGVVGYDPGREKYEFLPSAVAENPTTNGNLLTFSAMTYEAPDEIDVFSLKGKRNIALVEVGQFSEFVRQGKIIDSHTLAGYVYWQTFLGK